MTDAFDPTTADFSGADANAASDGLFVKTVVQEALVEVDASGTVAAAATESSDDDDESAPSGPELISIDTPFMFIIRDRDNGSILFMGHVNDPRQG